ncbi:MULTISPECIES: transglycosylase domain-containing protein [Paenibacillus]|uniref:transglycosylase domain-containing protein n=1 Tax=Paenibacillus TaxID=44249 RepID=UPI0022B8F990|nr:transglycosylase domain-containing protein [Paenibacillus caseinilyticus]MCZ8520241.1 transglycosylase domain-containing protein [Paenibacillus caseinilyticus]
MEMDQEKSEKNTKEPKKPRSYKRTFLTAGKVTLSGIKWLFILGLVACFLGGGAAFGYVTSLVKDDPVRSKDEMLKEMQDDALTGFVYFRDDSVVGQLRTEEDRRMVALSAIPQHVLDAVFAIEDKNFYEHNGVDLKGTARAVVQKLLKEDVQTGGSTITQQLARRVFLTLSRDDSRKAKEILLAMRMERLMSKDEILLAYLNKIPYGNGSSGYNVYGIKAAAKGIFNIDDLSKLNLAQAAYLAGLPQQPSNYSAFTSKGEVDGAAFKRAVQRQQLVLRRMLEEGKITEAQYQEALQFDLKSTLAEKVKRAYTEFPYLMIEVEREAAKALLKAENPKLNAKDNPEEYAEALKSMQTKLSRGGYHVFTTIDRDIYNSMQTIAADEKNFTPEDKVKGIEQIGAVLMDSKTSAVLGMIEGRDFWKEQLNHATQAYRQPGSTMKPIAAYIPAMEEGKIQPASVIDDVPIILKDGGKGYHIPENWDDGYHGLITARRAFNQSYNIPAIKLFLNDVGIEKAWKFANQIGVTSINEEDYVAQTGVIGGLRYGVTVRELTNAYATMGNKGVFNEAYLIRKITDSNGKVVFEHQLQSNPAFSEQTAYLITDMMRTVITSGTATDLMKTFKHYGQVPIVGKTGSTQDDADAWFMGYTPDITLGVWAGYDLPIHKLSKKTGGTNRAKNIWALVMDTTIEKHPDLFPTKTFERPADIVEMTVSSLSGKLPSNATSRAGKLTTDLFNKKYVPTEEDNVMVRLPVITYNGINYIAREETPSDFVEEKSVIKRPEPLGKLFRELRNIIGKLPADRKRSLDFYKPKDYSQDAPSETDPRKDDGNAPNAPTTVVATRSGDSNVITFGASDSGDAVGYRLYRSVNGGSFQRVGGKVVFAGDETKFTDSSSSGGTFGYYVTTVDVGGNESPPSKAAYTDGTSMDLLFGAGDGQPVKTEDGKKDAPGDEKKSDDKTADDKKDSSPPPKSVPAIPTGITAKSSGGGVELKWKANPDKDKVEQYNIYFSDKENGKYSKIGTVKGGTEFKYYAVSFEGYYIVSATNDVGESKSSVAVRFKK